MPPPSVNSARPTSTRRVFLETIVDCPVYARDRLAAGESITGPAVIQEYASTTILFPGDRADVAGSGELLIHLRESLT
jgi:N-methylhydantoinase A